MKIYLRNEFRKWILYENFNLKSEFKKRNIIIKKRVQIGNFSKISDNVYIGEYTKIGNNNNIAYNAIIKNAVKIGDYTEIGNSTFIGNNSKIGKNVRIGDCAKISNNVIINDKIELKSFAYVGSYSKITNYKLFSRTGIFINARVLMESENKGIFYKALNHDLTDYFNGHQYNIKGERKDKLKRDNFSSYGDGFHFKSLWGAVEDLSKFNGIIVSAEIEMDDILHINDIIWTKAYSNLKIVNMPIYENDQNKGKV